MQGTIPAKFSRMLTIAVVALTIFFLASANTPAQPRTEYRGFWVDTFNTFLNNHTQVLAVINNAKLAKANAIFVQVRRRGDSWYLNSLEPIADRQPIAPGFDPLLDLITEAHKPENKLEVHAFVIIGAVWNRDPRCPTLQPPAGHVFLSHGAYDPVTANIAPGPNNWLTRTLLPDTGPHLLTCQTTTPPNISFNGHRFGAEFWIDLGHPDAASYTNDVLMHLVQNYSLDGLHLDRIRYPDFAASGQTASNGTNIGYNETSVARFNARYGRTGMPAQNDPLWSQWRRDQVTNFVRRLYLNVVALKPEMKLSGSYIVFGGGPATEAAWTNAEAYWRVYQDWRAWTEEGITDIAMPMDYKREHTPAEATQFNSWSEWLKNHQYNRAGIVGQGIFVNSIEGSLRQTRRALAPSVQGKSPIGVSLYSMATTNVAVTNNPFSFPTPGVTTPLRTSFADVASGFTTGKSVNGLTTYEDPLINPIAIFRDPATIPLLSWKVAPTVGHIRGFAKRADNTPLDTANVTIENLATHVKRNTKTDGGGFFGGVDLAPGDYLVKVELNSEVLFSCVATVAAGEVTTADAGTESIAPVTTATLNPAAPDGANGWYRSDVAVTLQGADSCSGVASTEYSTDAGATWQPYTASFSISQEGTTTILYRSTDRAGNTETGNTVTIKLDKTAPTIDLTATPSIIKGNNGKPVSVTISGNGADAVSGLASVSYVVTDEYGTTLGIAPRTLSGPSATWTEALDLEARRNGNDLDGRLYRVTATITDAAGHTTIATTDIIVPHDQRDN